MKKILIFIVLIWSTNTQAQTIIGDAYYFNHGITWNKAGSPYIIRGNLVLSSSTLNIVDAKVVYEKGSIQLYNKTLVSVKDSDITSSLTSFAFSVFDSKMFLENVNLDTNKFLEGYGSNIEMHNLNSFNSYAKDLFSLYDKSNLSIFDSHIENYKGTVLRIMDVNELRVTNTEFVNNTVAMELHNGKDVSVTKNDFEFNDISIQSYIRGVDFENNFFQKDVIRIFPFKENVLPGEVNALIGPFDIQEISKQKNVQKKGPCCSNILFLPGMMGSRLYVNDAKQNQLWEPNRNADVKKLFLDSLGQSIENVITKDVVVKTNLLTSIPGVDQDIYEDFVAYMQTLKKDQLIMDFNAMPYDWRMSADSIIQNGIAFRDKSVDLVSIVQELQRSSKTKKVTIVTHSNGGLVAKELILELQKRKLDNLIDKVVFVAMPEYGTPQAITSLLYGHNQSILGGLILKSSVAKELGKNMPTAYVLLPSKKYYKNSGASQVQNDLLIDSYDNLNRTLLRRAEELHDRLDNMVYPTHISMYNILGTGLNTVSDVQISKKDASRVIPLYDKNGDGIVQDMHGTHAGTSMYVDLSDTNYKHVNIMNSTAVISNIDRILRPGKYDGEFLGLDYNKIIKNNNYKMLRISKSENELSKYLTPLDMDLSIGLSKLNQNTDNILFFDKLAGITRGEFREAKESLYKNNRFELIDDDINYLYTLDMENFSITSKTNNTVNISAFESIDGEITESEYKDISLFKGAKLVFDTDNNFNTLNVTLPVTREVIELESERVKTAKTVEQKVTDTIADIYASKLDRHLKDRYVRRLELYLANKDPKYLATIKQRVADSINSINGMSHSLALTARYAALKEGYVYLDLLLLKL